MWTQEPTSLTPSAPVASVEPWRYGGHRGGSRRRKDALLSGSPQAIAADKAKDAERQRRSRAAKREALNYSSPVSAAAAPQTRLPAAPASPLGKLHLFIALAAFAGLVAEAIASQRRLAALIDARQHQNSTPQNFPS